jgi:zona occludens toxin
MIYLFTGQPGSQKTANMIHFVMNDDQFKNRPVFFYNIRGCTVPDWQELTEEEVKEWYKLPEGSVVLIDEAQTIFRPQKWDKGKDMMVTELETHRHHGFDIVMTTQHPMLINTDVRRQVQQHRHYKKPYGLKSSCAVWEKAVTDPENAAALREAENRSGNVPKSVFDLYTSTVLNTHKKRIPKKLVVFICLVLGVVASIGYFAWDISSRMDSASTEADLPKEAAAAASKLLSPSASDNSGNAFNAVYPLDPVEYAKMWQPRIPSMPETAPVYDELIKPTVAPKTRCYGYHRDGEYNCKCVTQQMTPVEMEYQQCVNIVNNGLWDPAPIRTASYDNQGRIM